MPIDLRDKLFLPIIENSMQRGVKDNPFMILVSLDSKKVASCHFYLENLAFAKTNGECLSSTYDAQIFTVGSVIAAPGRTSTGCGDFRVDTGRV